MIEFEIIDLFSFLCIASKRRNNMRFVNSIQNVPPKIPVNSYHCASSIDFAKLLPSCNQGQDISMSQYIFSQEIQVAIKNMYGKIPLLLRLLHLKIAKIALICSAFSNRAKILPIAETKYIQKVVAILKRRNSEK